MIWARKVVGVVHVVPIVRWLPSLCIWVPLVLEARRTIVRVGEIVRVIVKVAQLPLLTPAPRLHLWCIETSQVRTAETALLCTRLQN